MASSSQIKILYILQGVGIAGAESYALNLIEKMSASGRVKCFVASCYPGPLLERFNREHLEVMTLNGKDNLKSICAVIRFARLTKINIIHCIDLKSTIVGGIASLFLKDVKTVTTVHGLPERYKGLVKQITHSVSLMIYYILLRMNFDAKICVSNDLRERVKYVIGRKRTFVIHNGIDLVPIDATSPSTLQSFPINIGTVGRVEKVKGHEYFISAAQMILGERKNIAFHIIGAGPLEKSLKETVENLGLAGKVHFHGFRPDARSLMNGLDIFVMSSLHEGIPYVLLEAMAAGKPVVCTAVGGVPEVVTHNVDGILVPPKDPIGLCNAVRELLAKRELMEMLGKNARDTIEKRFSSTLMSERTYNVYLDLMPC